MPETKLGTHIKTSGQASDDDRPENSRVDSQDVGDRDGHIGSVYPRHQSYGEKQPTRRVPHSSLMSDERRSSEACLPLWICTFVSVTGALAVAMTTIAVVFSQPSGPGLDIDASNTSATLRSYSAILKRAIEGNQEIHHAMKKVVGDRLKRDVQDGSFLLGNHLIEARKTFEDMTQDYDILKETDMYKQFEEVRFSAEIIYAITGFVLKGNDSMARIESARVLLKDMKDILLNNTSAWPSNLTDMVRSFNLPPPLVYVIHSLGGWIYELWADINYNLDKHALLAGHFILAFILAFLTIPFSGIKTSLPGPVSIPIPVDIAIAILTLAPIIRGIVLFRNPEAVAVVINTMNQKIVPIIDIIPDHLPMTDGTWRNMLRLHEKGVKLSEVLEIKTIDLKPFVDMSDSVKKSLSLAQTGNEFQHLIEGIDVTTTKHKEYQEDLVLFLEQIQFLYMGLVTDLNNSWSLINLLDSLKNHLARVELLDVKQKMLNAKIVEIVNDLSSVEANASKLKQVYEKCKEEMERDSGLAGIIQSLIKPIALSMGVSVDYVVQWTDADIIEKHLSALLEVDQFVQEKRDFVVKERDIVGNIGAVSRLRQAIAELYQYAKNHQIEAHTSLSDRQRNFYFKAAINKAEKGVEDIDKVIEELRKLTAD